MYVARHLTADMAHNPAGLRHFQPEEFIALAIVSLAALEKAHQIPALLIIAQRFHSRNYFFSLNHIFENYNSYWPNRTV